MTLNGGENKEKRLGGGEGKMRMQPSMRKVAKLVKEDY